ncbi:probable pectate lyase 9 [Coffea arabica]
MGIQGIRTAPWCTVWALIATISIITSSPPVSAKMNVIDKCWRTDRNWRSHRHQLATCSVGYAGKMMNNIGRDVINYKVTDPSDDALNPKPGTLRYAMTHVKGKVWITFKRDMNVTLQKPLLVSSFTAIDGRGVNVHISGGACLVLQRANNVIIHGLRIHNCVAQPAGPVVGPDAKIVHLGPVDGDAIRMLSSSKIWIDHNTLYDCPDGLIDVTRGSTGVTISNNWFRSQNKVMLLGHDDGFRRDKDMKVTVAFNHFGPRCQQRMPRVRFGYAHVVNNLYLGWGAYAIGGSMDPTIKSQANLFIAPKDGNKEVTWRQHNGNGMSWNFLSVEDVFENGASFSQSRSGGGVAVRPNYSAEQIFPIEAAREVRALTKSAGALKCPRVSRC